VTAAIVRREPVLTSIATSSPLKRLWDAFFEGRNAHTIRAYEHDFEDFAKFLEDGMSSAAALQELITCDGPRAHELVARYQGSLLARKLAPATINRRMSTLRTFIKLGSAIGVVHWKLEIRNVPETVYRDTSGPGEEAFDKMLAAVRTCRTKDESGVGHARGIRDAAILRLLHNPALRRGEIVGLDLKHYRRGQPPALFVLRKRQVQRLWVTIPPGTQEALEAWIEVRGDEPGPLFTAMTESHFGHRLTGSAVHYMVSHLGMRAAGVKTRPHGLRHTGASSVARESNGNVLMVQKFLGHKDPRVSMRYIDAQTDVAGEAARLIDRLRVPVPAAPVAPPQPAARPSGPHWDAFCDWFEKNWPGEEPATATAVELATFVRDRPDRKTALEALWSLRKWSEDEVATMKKILGVG
jgi:integrase/recombinase XerC